MAPASTGRDSKRRMAVNNTDQGKRGVFSVFWDLVRILDTVAMKLAAPKIDLAPAKCREKIAISTGGPLCAMLLDRGG